MLPRQATTSIAAATPRARSARRALGLASGLSLLPAASDAVIFYDVAVGFRQPAFDVSYGDRLEPQKIDIPEFTFRGALCPAPGTPNFLCGRLLSEAGNAGGRLFLRSTARFERTNADPEVPETAAYADTEIWVTELGGWVASGPAPLAAFYFGLSGTLSKTTNNPNVEVVAFSVATLQAGNGGGAIQCAGEVDCTPQPTVEKLMVTDWDPRTGFRLRLRSDVAAGTTLGTGGWDAEVVADFGDTLELLAIEVMDENGKPMPDVELTSLDENGLPDITFPNEAPAPEPGQALLVLAGGLSLAIARRTRRGWTSG